MVMIFKVSTGITPNVVSHRLWLTEKVRSNLKFRF